MNNIEMPIDNIIQSCSSVVKNAKHVTISLDSIHNAATFIKESLDTKPITSNNQLEFNSQNEELNFFLIFSSINFCFWSMYPKITNSISFQSLLYDCYKQGALPTDFTATDISLNRFKEMLKNSNYQLIDERIKIIQDLFLIMKTQFDGSVNKLLEECDFDSLKIVAKLANNFYFFKDISKYRGERVIFHKKAQAFVSYISKIEIYINTIRNLAQITALADYRLPQALRHLGVLTYSNNISQKIDNEILLRKDSEEEVELRASTIFAVEEIKNYLAQHNFLITSLEIDNFLWNFARNTKEIKPHHRCISIFY